MPHSLRAKIKGLRYKGIIADKDCDRLCKALDNEDVLDKIRAELMLIEGMEDAIEIIDKYRGKDEITEHYKKLGEYYNGKDV